METAFTDVMEMILAEPSARRLSNTSFYYQPYKVACGCFFDRDDWIEAGLRGRGGFFDALRPPEGSATEMRWYRFGDDDSAHHRIQRHGSDGAPRGTADGMIWNETGVYGSVMLSQYCIIAELMRLHGGIDLWSYAYAGRRLDSEHVRRLRAALLSRRRCGPVRRERDVRPAVSGA